MKRFFPIAAMLLLCNAGALAQYTNILDGGTEQTVTNTWTTNTIWVGTSSSNNSLYVVDGGAITATNVYVGSTSNATGNTVAVMGTGTLYVEDTLTLGTGMSNSVSVSGGGMVSVGDLVIHSNNSFNVDSGGTFAISNDLDIAMDGFRWKSGGTIIVEDGNVSGISGFSGDDKTLVIDGGSWSNDASAVYVGIDGNKNQLVITNGGLVTSTSGYVGYGLEVDTNYSSFVSIDGNVVSNSAISISAASATLEASSGYLLYDSSAYLTLGLATNTSGSLAVSGTNSITLAGATNLLMVQSNLVVVNNGLFYISGDTNTTITAVEPTYVDASSNSVLVSGAGSTWSISNNLVVGAYGSHNSLVINDGGTVSNAIGYIGFGDNATNNSVTVSGAGSKWINIAGELYVGAAAQSGSSLTVTNDGWVYVGETTANDIAVSAEGGILVASTNGAVMLVDNGSTVETTGGLYIGGVSTSLVGTVSVANGSTVEAQALIIGSNTNNALNIDNGGTLSIMGSYNYDTQNGVNWNPGGTLSVSGTLTNSSGMNGTERTLVIDGGSWDAASDISIEGTNNTVSIINRASVTNDNAYVGYDAFSSNNTVLVSGDGSLWLNNGMLYIGSTNSGFGNFVTVSDGGRMEADDLIIADGNSFNLNKDGTLAINGSFNLAQQNNLAWEAGGSLAISGELSLPTTNLVANGSTNAYAYIDGGLGIALEGTMDLGATNLIVGYLDSNNGLIISNGASVVNADGYIGWGDSSASNSVLVTATSSWINAGGDLYVGAYWSGTNLVNTGLGNSLTVEDEAWVNIGETLSYPTNFPGGSINFAGGSMLVASADGAQLVVGRGTVNIENTLYLGIDTNTPGTAIIRSGGTLTAADLQIADGSLLDLQRGGTLAMTEDFNLALYQPDLLVWNPGGTLSVGGTLTGMAVSNNAYYLDGGRNLTLDGGTWNISGTNMIVGYGGSDSDLVVKNTGTLSSATTYIGWDTSSDYNTVAIQGGSVWTSSGDLWVGHAGSGNSLTVSSSGSVDVDGNAYIGNVAASGNSASVKGSNSVWHIANDLFIGGLSNSVDNSLSVSDSGQVQLDGDLAIHSSNSLSLASGGLISLGGDMSVYSNASLKGTGTIRFGDNNSVLSLNGVDTGADISHNLLLDGGLGSNRISVNNGIFTVAGASSLQYTNFQTLVLSGDKGSKLAGYGALDGFNTIDMTGGMIDPFFSESLDTATLTIGGTFTAASGTVYSAQVYENRHDLLIFTNTVDLSNMEVDVLVVTAPDGPVAILSATNRVGFFSSETVDDRLLLYKAVLKYEGNEVQVVLVEDSLGASMEFASTEMIRAGFNSMKNSVFTRTKQLRRNLVSTAHSIPNEVYLLTSTNAPAGAMGPGDQNTIFDMHVWMQQFSGQGDFDQQGSSDGFALNNQGTMIGADRLIGDALVLGFNYTYARSSVRTTGMDDLDAETYWLGAYGEWVGEQGLYVDAMAAFGFSNYDAKRREGIYVGTASYRGQAFGAYADVGQYYYHGNLALSPYAGVHVLSLLSDGHRETDELGSSVYVDEVGRDMLESSIGLKMRHRFDTRMGRFQTTGYAEWAHDFIEDDVSATMTAQGFPPVKTGIISPDPDTVNAGLGYSWISTDYLEIGVGYHGRFSENYEEHTGSLMLDIMF